MESSWTFFNALLMNIVALGTVSNFQTNILHYGLSNQSCRFQYSRDFLIQCVCICSVLSVLPKVALEGSMCYVSVVKGSTHTKKEHFLLGDGKRVNVKIKLEGSQKNIILENNVYLKASPN